MGNTQYRVSLLDVLGASLFNDAGASGALAFFALARGDGGGGGTLLGTGSASGRSSTTTRFVPTAGGGGGGGILATPTLA